MAITASLVKELRERTGCGMMECKKALVATDGDIEAAVEEMRKKGMAKNDKLASRVAAEGTVAFQVSDDATSGALVEINCETDFVSGGDAFKAFANTVAKAILENDPQTADDILTYSAADGRTIKEIREELLLTLGENIQIRRFEKFNFDNGLIDGYLHGNKIGVMIALEGGNSEVARDIAMHVAALNPLCVSEEDVPADVLEKEKGILIAQAEESGKPKEIIEKMIQGRLKKYLAEITLVGQPFVKDGDITVGKLLSNNGAKVLKVLRYAVGEGIEKKEENFAEEVMAQVKGA